MLAEARQDMLTALNIQIHWCCGLSYTAAATVETATRVGTTLPRISWVPFEFTPTLDRSISVVHLTYETVRRRPRVDRQHL